MKQDKNLISLTQDNSKSAEYALVACMLHDVNLFMEETIGLIKAEHFYNPFCQVVYRRVKELYERDIPIDAIAISAGIDAELKMSEEDIISSLGEIFDAYPSVVNIKGWIDVIVSKYVNRKIEEVGIEMVDLAHSTNFDQNQKIGKFENALQRLQDNSKRSKVLTTTEMVAQAVMQLEKNSQNEDGVTGLPTGIDALDEKTRGLGGGDLVVIGARPSMGKTAFLISICKYMTHVIKPEKRVRGLMFSLEMKTVQIGVRWLCAVADVAMDNFKTGRVTPSERDRINKAVDASEHDTMEIVDKNDMGIDEVCATARKEHAKSPLGFIGIDYLQLIKFIETGSKDNKSEKIAYISRALKNLALELNIPVIALSQLSRELEKRPDKRPMMSDLRESGAIEQDADIIMFLYRDVVYNKNTKNPDEIEIIIAKQRNGATGTVKAKYVGATTTVVNA